MDLKRAFQRRLKKYGVVVVDDPTPLAEGRLTRIGISCSYDEQSDVTTTNENRDIAIVIDVVAAGPTASVMADNLVEKIEEDLASSLPWFQKEVPGVFSIGEPGIREEFGEPDQDAQAFTVEITYIVMLERSR